jgi:hypothetical protein
MQTLMRDSAATPFALVFLIIGGVLLDHASSESQTSQTAALLCGAALLSLGLIGTWAAVNDWLKWRKAGKEFRSE